ncbi:MAG: hypothetical protein IKZ37_02805 [Bacteroidaceae bacterium]|nr:hypothetical protein [Bacteroidaceae bacterium]
MLTYSIAIRTLGTAGDKFRRELESIARQTVQPQKVMVYIAQEYERPAFTVGREEYVWVPKGMVAQRVLSYDEIESDCILMLDDDVELSDDCAEQMLEAIETHSLGCVGVDIFENHKMSTGSKIYAAATNLVFPHWSNKWAFKIHRNGSFSYINNPVKPLYMSQSCGGPISMWKKSVFLSLNLEDELWLETLGFAYGEDAVIFNKLHRNGYKLGILFNSGVKNLDAGASSSGYKKSPDRMYIRSKASFIIWWRTCYDLLGESAFSKMLTACCYIIKAIWLFFVMCGVAMLWKQALVIKNYVKGIYDGWKFVHSPEYKKYGNYILDTK